MKNQFKLNSIKEIILFLMKRFPNCFIDKGNIRPLKIGIFHDILVRLTEDDGISKTKLRSALRIYTSSLRYLYGVKEGTKRIDLDGNDCDILESEHIEYARQQLIEIKSRIQNKRIEQKFKKLKFRQKIYNIDNTNFLVNVSNNKNRAKKTYNKNKIVNLIQFRPVTDISKLKVGQLLKVMVGRSIVDASVIEISKDDVRVQLMTTGLAMIVRAEHLKF